MKKLHSKTCCIEQSNKVIHFCIDCGKKVSAKGVKRCLKCHVKYFRGKNHPNSKEKNKCIDCGKELKYRTERCRLCYIKYSRGANHPSYKGIKHYCIDCSTEVSSSETKRCKKCYLYYRKQHPIHKKTEYYCIDCGKLVSGKYIKRCWICYVKHNRGENHNCYRGIKYNCIDCGKKINSKHTKRCISCYLKYRHTRKRHYPKCIDCGKEVSNKHAKRCQKCHIKFNRGKNHPCWKEADHTYKCIDCGKELGSRSRPVKRCRECYYKQLGKGKNKYEETLENLLNKIGLNEYKYVGDGKFTIERYNPDFINCNGKKKIIEFFGDYWHNRKERIAIDKRKLRTYRKYGYDCLVIWGHNLSDKNLTDHILRFHNKINKHSIGVQKCKV